MIRNYLLIALRTLQKNRFYSGINILGLAFGLTVCMLIVCWVMDEFNTNRFNKNGDNIYRLNVNVNWNGVQTMDVTPLVLADRIRQNYPEVETLVKVMNSGENLLFKAGAHSEKISSSAYVSADFLDHFDYPLLYGNRHDALTKPDAVVISKEMAQRFFGSTNAIGQTIQLEEGTAMLVTGILDEMPANANLKFDCLINIEYNIKQNPWLLRPGSFSVNNYLILKPGTDITALTKKMQQEVSATGQDKAELWLQPFEDTYLYGRYENGKVAGGRIEYVRLFLITALIVLAIACINFMNLATARASKRGREVGVRKSLGAARKSLILQFAGEAMVMALIAAVISVIAVVCLLPLFNQLTGKAISFHGIIVAKYLLVLLLITIVAGLLAGSYPAFVLSAFSPVKVLKGDLKSGGGTILRRNLVVLQFVLSFGFIVGSLVIYHQTKYIYNRNLGVDRANMMYVQLDKGAMDNSDAIEEALKQLPQVKSVTYSSWLPISVEGSSADLSWSGKPDNVVLSTAPLLVGYDFITTMGIQLKEGRDFSKAFSTDSAAYVINESAARMMNMTDPVGKTISFWIGKGTVIGVVKDFHFNTMHKQIGPMVMMLQTKGNSYMLLKLNSGTTAAAIDGIDKVFKTLNPKYPLVYHFLDEEFDRLYKSESLLKQLAAILAVIAVFISCLGLLGLSVFTAEQRKKEISIRKVLGASVTNLTTTLAKEYLKPVLIAILIATPVSWYLLQKWLSGYAYHVELTAWIFIVAALLAVIIAVATVSVQSIKAATTNPVQHLKSE